MSEWEARLDNCMQAGSGLRHHRWPDNLCNQIEDEHL